MPANVRQLSADGVTSITQYDWGTLLAGQAVTPRKFGLHSTSDRDLLNLIESIIAIPANDGSGQMRIALDGSGTLSCPWDFAAVLGASGAGGVWGATGTYGFRITSLDANGESGPQDEITVAVDDTTKKVTLSWTQVPSATGYKIYRTATPGTYGASTLRTTIGAGATVSFVDDGSATSTGTLPTANTTGGWKLGATLSGGGAGGTWSPTGVYYWKVVAYDSTGVEIANSLEVSVNVDVSTKTVALAWASASAAGAGASSIKVFRSTVSGTYTSPALVATLAGSATSYTDTGSAVISGGWTGVAGYGLPPASASFGTADILFSTTIAIGEETYYWVWLVIPGGTSEVGNPRQAITQAEET